MEQALVVEEKDRDYDKDKGLKISHARLRYWWTVIPSTDQVIKIMISKGYRKGGNRSSLTRTEQRSNTAETRNNGRQRAMGADSKETKIKYRHTSPQST